MNAGAVFPHALLALFLLLQKLALAGRVAAVAFGGNVLAEGRDGFAGDDLAADRGLDRELEQVPWEQVFQPLEDAAAAGFGVAVSNPKKRRCDSQSRGTFAALSSLRPFSVRG